MCILSKYIPGFCKSPVCSPDSVVLRARPTHGYSLLSLFGAGGFLCCLGFVCFIVFVLCFVWVFLRKGGGTGDILNQLHT